MPNRLVADLSRASLSALCFLVWDICITFDEEVEYIWTKPPSSWIKWSFFFARYFTLLTQICNRTVEFAVIYDDSFAPAHQMVLRVWLGLQVLLGFLIMTGAEIVMMARVYALYNKHKWVGLGFITLLLVEVATVTTGVAVNFPRREALFKPDDITNHASRSFVYFGITTLVSQVIILVLSIVRYVRGQWGRARIIQLMLRDGTIAFCVLFVVTGTLLLHVALDFPYASTNYSFMLTFISIIECRLILNLQNHSSVESEWTTSQTAEQHELTTIIDTHGRYFEDTQLEQSSSSRQTSW
ncbi:hypothetical protein PM082_000925 [Marasmius tenuissimus]|nr:hypothetical protein PM082_000925 [Marasmius tenuissimus]